MKEILFTIFLNEETHLWDILTEDEQGKFANIYKVAGGNQLWAMRDITQTLLEKGYTATFKLDTGSTLKFFDVYEDMVKKWKNL